MIHVQEKRERESRRFEWNGSIDQRQEIQFTTVLFEKCHHIKLSFVNKRFSVHLRLFIHTKWQGKKTLSHVMCAKSFREAAKNIDFVLFDRIYWAVLELAVRSSFGNE